MIPDLVAAFLYQKTASELASAKKITSPDQKLDANSASHPSSDHLRELAKSNLKSGKQPCISYIPAANTRTLNPKPGSRAYP